MTKCNGLPSERGPGAEAAAESNLHALPIETLLPLVRRRVHHATRAPRMVLRPLFLGYFFARFCAAVWNFRFRVKRCGTGRDFGGVCQKVCPEPGQNCPDLRAEGHEKIGSEYSPGWQDKIVLTLALASNAECPFGHGKGTSPPSAFSEEELRLTRTPEACNWCWPNSSGKVQARPLLAGTRLISSQVLD